MRRLIALLTVLAALTTACEAGNVFSLEVGNCFNDPDSFEEVNSVEIVDCAEPHDNEVFATYEMTTTSFPGQDIAVNQGQQRCVVLFDGYVGRDYASSSLEVGVLTPTAESWERLDDREVVCLLYDVGLRKLTGSVKNTGI